MHLVYLTQYYVTEDQPGSSRHYRHARYLADHGHKVTVITSYVTHAERVIPERYQGRKIVMEQDGPITVYKTYATPGYGRDVLSRLSNYFTFMFYCLLAGLRVKDVDVVLASINPVSVGVAGWLLALWYRVNFVLEVCDLSAESAMALQVTRTNFLPRLLGAVEAFLSRRARRVIALSPGIQKGIVAKGVPQERVGFIPLGIDVELFEGPISGASIRHNDEEFIALYTGTYATYPHLDTVLEAAHLLRAVPDLRIVLIGGGDRKSHLLARAEELQLHNVEILRPRPKRELPRVWCEADVCLLPYRDADVFRGVLPNKLFDYLGSGRPIIAAVRTGDITEVLEASRAGLCVPPENPQAMAEAIKWMHDHREEARRMGQRGREYGLEHYDRAKIMRHYRKILEQVVDGRSE